MTKKKQTIAPTPATVCNRDDTEYVEFVHRMNHRLWQSCDTGKMPLFTTDATKLWELYLAGFSYAVERQYHNCNACRHFVERFGSLATIDNEGVLTPAIWDADDAPEAYKASFAAMAKAVRRAKVTGVFLSSLHTWGTPVTGDWKHMAVQPPTRMLHSNMRLNADQAMAEKREDYATVMRALAEFKPAHLETALRLLKSDALYRGEKLLGQVEWLQKLQASKAALKGERGKNVAWLAVAQAPAGFCHPRAGMVGSLLEDIASGKDYEAVSKAFAAKMHPLAYQRPQAAPKAGTLAEAEKLVEKLGIAKSLERRFCRVDEVKALWRPSQVQKNRGDGVFSHLQPKGEEAKASMRLPERTMTWVKFRDEVLPGARRIEMRAPARGSYAALVTAVHADAPPILQWDHVDERNPVSWYFWNGGSLASSFGLHGGSYVDVLAIALKPSMWMGDFAHQGKGVMFVLKGALESRQCGNALFPEILKSDLHGIRSVIEGYSKSAKIEGMDEPHAAGPMFSDDKGWNCRVRVHDAQGVSDYRIDRWD